MDDIIKLISTVGFPIVMCLLQWWDKRTTLDNNTRAIDNIETAINHVEIAIAKNTEMITSLSSAITNFAPKE